MNIADGAEDLRSLRDKAVAEVLEECVLHLFESKKPSDVESKQYGRLVRDVHCHGWRTREEQR